MPLPQEILERCRRVYEYHHATKHTHESVRLHPVQLDPATQPSPYRVFEQCPKVPLPTGIMDVSVPTISLLEVGFEALPDSQLNPPQTLKTLATWLYLANGQTIKQQTQEGRGVTWSRSCPSQGQLYPQELYVAAFAIEGLEPGLYHYSVKEFALRKLRTGHAALAALTRGRPDLNFLKTVPLTILVSTIFWRPAWRYEKRAYRQALLDAGHVIGNLTTVAMGLGITTITRLRAAEATTRELIGLAGEGVPFGEEEAVQAMVAWADKAERPMPPPAPGVVSQPLAAIARSPLSKEFKSYGWVMATHRDCVAPGVTVKEVRPPHTELSPLPATFATEAFPPLGESPTGDALRKVLLTRQPTTHFDARSIPRNDFFLINRLALRGGSFFPMFPDGPHVGLVRPLWITFDITGMESGIWYYNPVTDGWSLLNRGGYEKQAAHISLEQQWAGESSATCFLVANVHHLMTHAGPDTYRLAHLEAGIVAQRMHLAASAMGLGCGFSGVFYDDEVRKFFGLAQTGWEVMYEVALGVPLAPGARRMMDVEVDEEEEDDDEVDKNLWRD
ncbi:MAG: SagB/ThcOx family dehydrogenase [Tepidisphaeraceae bacterium]